MTTNRAGTRAQLAKTYWRYLKYVLEHKYFVAIECFKRGMFIHAVTHDLSKFLPSEFKPYAIKFFSGDYSHNFFAVELHLEEGWLLHQRRNKHHWDYWVNSSGVALPMPHKHIKQMVCDWEAMGRKFGDTAKEYYIENKEKINLHRETEFFLRNMLGVFPAECEK